MGLGWVGSIRSSLRFIYKIVNTVRICEILFHKSPFELILHSNSITQNILRSSF